MPYRAGFDVGYFVRKITSNWVYIFGSIVIVAVLALLTIYFLPKTYKVSATLKIEDGTSNAITENLFDGVKLVQENLNTANEIAILKSFELVREALKTMDYKVSYFRKSGFRSEEIYSNRPFSIVIDSNFNQIINTPIHIKFINNERFAITVKQSNVELFNYKNPDTLLTTSIQEVSLQDTLRLDEYIETSFLKLKLVRNYDFDIDHDFHFVIENINTLAENYSQKLSILPVSKDASILKLSIASTVPDREIDFINQLINLYVQRSVNNKNKVAQNILDFIDNQLSDISDTLRTAEMALQNFRSSSKVLDIDYESKNIFEELKSLEKQKSEELIKFKYYDYLNKYVKENSTPKDILAPSMMGIQDQTLNELINTLSGYMAQMTAISYSAKERNPKYNILQENIENTRLAILENVQNIKVSSEIKLNDIQQRLNHAQQQVDALPENERKLFSAQRKFEFNDNIYNYFLEKRGEAAIIKESNIPSEIIIDHARIEGSEPVSPNKKMILIAFLGVGMTIPVGWIFMKDIVSAKILSKEDLFNGSNPAYSLIAEIVQNKNRKAKPMALLEKNCYESFRSLKMRIENDTKLKVIAIVSLINGDGKTFCAFNLARVFAFSSKKTLLIDLSIENTTLSEIEHKDEGDYIRTIDCMGPLGKIVRTPVTKLELLLLTNDGTKSIDDLINRDRFSALLDKMRPLYDYIIIDCPALKHSANFLSVNNLTDLNLVVVKRNHTPSDLSNFQDFTDSDTSRYRYVLNC